MTESRNKSEETARFSWFTNTMCAIIGTFVALVLYREFNWGGWSLVVTIPLFSATGWILADLKGFIASCKRAWRITAEGLPKAWHETLAFLQGKRRELQIFNTSTGCYKSIALTASWTMPILAFFFYGVVKDPQASAPIEWLGLSFVSLLWLVVETMTICVFGLVTPADKRLVIARDLWYALPAEERPPVSDSTDIQKDELSARFIRSQCPEIWEQAEGQTRIWSKRGLVRWNPISAPFVLFGGILRGLGWLIKRVPQIAYVLLTVCPRWIIQTAVKFVSLIYHHANFDLRRIAFTSIALGMAIGYTVGCYRGNIPLGMAVGGAACGLIGILQHHFVYQALVRQTTT
ncbi:MAG: hypothetical protein U9M92_02780 [Patescibacteria group bacterium]|nr:hypothetical protein [Patescibacteria group bacterium]